jgi:hypothetical protein
MERKGAIMIPRTRILTHILLALVACIGVASGTATAQNSDVPFALRVLESEVQQSENDVRAMSQSLPEQKKASIGELLTRQKSELTALIAKYRGRMNASATEMSKDAAPFSKFAPEIWKQFAGGGGIVKTGNSDGPHECSNHCYETCGYNSLGDLICYNKCVKCCNSGGC